MPPRSTKSELTQKWQHAHQKFSGWDTPAQRRVQETEAAVMTGWLLTEKLPHYDILEVGCGNGYFGRCVIQALQTAGVSFTYHFTDFLPECVEQAEALVQDLAVSDQVSFSELDVYDIEQTLGHESQSIILSTGFASAVTYKDAVPKVAATLKPGGLLLCDFVNHFSPTVFLRHPLSAWRMFRAIQQGHTDDTKRYHFGAVGLYSFFAQFNLILEKKQVIRWRRNPLLCQFRKQ